MKYTENFYIWKNIWKWWAILGVSIFIGVCFWHPFQGLAAESFIGYILVFAPLVIIPIAMFLIADNNHIIYKVTCCLQPMASLSALLSLVIQKQEVAVALASLWLLQNLLFFGYGLWRLQRYGIKNLPQLCITAGFLYIPVAGVWLIIHLLGKTFGFGPDIVILTAVHFHYAGFAAPIITGFTGRWLEKNNIDAFLYRVGAYFVVFCPFLVAIGITYSPLLELISANLLAVAILLISYVLLFKVAPKVAFLPRTLFAIAALSLAVTMVLAGFYAVSEYWQLYLISIPTMAKTHGFANAFGFSLCGLLGYLSLEIGSFDSQQKI